MSNPFDDIEAVDEVNLETGQKKKNLKRLFYANKELLGNNAVVFEKYEVENETEED
jgi:hypothetical protein